jgi:hypothetical protein
MFQKLLALLCVCVFLAGAVGCSDKTPVAQDHEGKIPNTSTEGGDDNDTGTKSGAQSVTG